MTNRNSIVALQLGSVAFGFALSAGCAASIAAQQPEPKVFAPGVISGPANDLSPAFTPDGRTVLFTRANSSQSVILVSHLSGDKWTKPAIAPFSGTWRDLEATMAPDGSFLIFASNRPAAPGGEAIDAYYNGAAQPGIGGNLWRVDRTPNGWGEPHRLPDVINSNGSIFSPSIAADGSVYFMKPVGDQARFHIFRAQFSHGTYETPVEVPISAGDSVGDYDPAVAPDESFIVFSSARMKANGTSLFIAVKKGDTWGTPTYMGEAVSPPHSNDIESRLSPDHRTLYYSTTREVPITSQPGETAEKGLAMMEAWNNGLANIWEVSLDSWIGSNGAAK
jgi:Tol biopolymer transport system component